ncbi:MAG: hypothetical protein QOD07_540 [Frankiaceae bacterium]|nr:hypothetical protein [Frankiaceae bacterium]
MADQFQNLDYYTWQPYPSTVPAARRSPCATCGARAEVVRYRHDEIIGPCTAFASVSSTTTDLFTPFCMKCAHQAGYGTYQDRGVQPPHLNGLQRWLAHILDTGDPEHLA